MILPNFLQPHHCDDLVRLGRDNDGGYLASNSDIMRSDILIGLGIHADWTFEKDFVSKNDCPLYAYDATTHNFLFFLVAVKAGVKFIIRRGTFKDYLKAIFLPFSYLLFFRGNKKHIRKFVSNEKGKKNYSFESAMQPCEGKKIFLKLDIEGAEYPLLKDILQTAASLTGLVIEFHDCHKHRDEIKDFISALPLDLVHLHINNFAPLENDIPQVVELTFSRYGAGQGKRNNLPHSLDMPNNPRHNDIELVFAK